MKGIGKTINFMEREFILGLMAGNMMGHMLMIRKRGSVLIHGQMAESMKGVGRMENNTVKEIYSMKKASVKKVIGRMGIE